VKDVVHADLQNKHYVEWIRFLRESEGWSKEQIEEYQLAELKRIVTYAYENTKAYRALYDSVGITPEAIQTVEDFRKLPFVEKETIRDNLEAFSTDVPGRYYHTTGGSTGVPLGFYRDPVSWGRELASKAHQYYRVGWKEEHKQFVLRGGEPILTEDHTKHEPEFHEFKCSSLHLSPKWMEIYRKKAWDYKPDWLKCYPSSGYFFAKFLKETQRPFPPIKGILCASENLYDFQRELLSEVFGVHVFSHYGQCEMVVLAGFCEHEDTYHVLPQYGYAELVGKDGKPVTEPGQLGEIVGTSFIMNATPFVRYRIGDLAVLKEWDCTSCGRPYQIWERIEGRAQEFFVTGTGRYIAMTALNMHDDIFDHIRRFQFFQKEKGQVVFRFAPKDNCNEKIVRAMKGRLMLKFGDDVELEMERVEEIPLTPQGKQRFLIQEMKLGYGVDG
jgi:phenylacetate-CoA ligase